MIDRFYLIVEDTTWLDWLVPLGVRLVQLRIKDRPADDIRSQIRHARRTCAAHGAQLVINDHWRIALDEGCDFVHLGQEDMDCADFAALNRAGCRYGLSTHDETELERALSHDPAYVALGPVYPTRLKKMKWEPQGLERVWQWKEAAGETPLVAIGGLTPERLSDVFTAGADSAAVVTDIRQSTAPEARTLAWLEATR